MASSLLEFHSLRTAYEYEVRGLSNHHRAAGFGVPLVSIYDWFNGPDHTEDPRAKGYVGPDGFHPSTAGREAIVAALHEAGYEPLHP